MNITTVYKKDKITGKYVDDVILIGFWLEYLVEWKKIIIFMSSFQAWILLEVMWIWSICVHYAASGLDIH